MEINGTHATMNWLKRTQVHGLEINAIVELFTPLFIKFKLCLQKRLFISACGSQSIY